MVVESACALVFREIGVLKGMRVRVLVFIEVRKVMRDTAFVVGRLVVVLFPIALALIPPAAIIQADYVRE